MSTWAVIVAAGQGTRFGGLKQYEVINGRRVLDWSLAAARSSCDHVVLVVAPQQLDVDEPDAEFVVEGGTTRSDSVRAGLSVVPAEVEIIVIHDAARPFATPALFNAVIDAVRAGADGAVPGIPVVDTIKRVNVATNEILETLDRSSLVAVQTPQAFTASILRQAHDKGGEATDDASLVEQSGGKIVVVTGELENRKVTNRHDLELPSGTKQ